MEKYDSIQPIRWSRKGLLLLDQRRLPAHRVELCCRSASEVADAIRDMVVRGAPAIGIAAAYGVALAVRSRYQENPESWREAIAADLDILTTSRPTAVNLFWALKRMAALMVPDGEDPVPRFESEAIAIHDEDIAANHRMGELGAALISEPSGILTHCNAGALATGGYGTALGVIRSAFAAGKLRQVYADETRPWLQGARLTAWELEKDGIPAQLIADGAAAYLMQRGMIRWVVVGSDRIAANGDVANKIGTYGLAVNARHHGVGFMVVAPTSTLDMSIASGLDIPIEERSSEEVLNFQGISIAPQGGTAWNPVFDVTPAALVDVLVTERGVVKQPNREKLIALMAKG